MSTTWKQVVYDVANAWREANDSTAKIPVSELPNKVKEGGENIDPELTTLETTLQQVLDILPFKGAMASGKYVWRKLANEAVEIKITAVKTGQPCYIEMNSDTVDLTTVDGHFFTGLKGTYGDGNRKWEIVSGTQLDFNGAIYSLSYNPETRRFAVGFGDSTLSAWTPTNNLYIKEFVGYVVSDNASEYPDMEEHVDGYWYARMDLDSKTVDFGEITLSGAATSITVSHSLDAPPSWAIIAQKDAPVGGLVTNINGKVFSTSPTYATALATTKSNSVVTFRNTNVNETKFPAATYYWFVVR